jgi:hypothetical protein
MGRGGNNSSLGGLLLGRPRLLEAAKMVGKGGALGGEAAQPME